MVRSLAAAGIVCAFAAPAFAGQISINFDGCAAGTPVASLNQPGVSFATIGSPSAQIAMGLPGTTPIDRDPQIVGSTAGILSLNFNLPTSSFSFKFALNTTSAVAAAAQVRLYDTGGSMIALVTAESLPNLAAGKSTGQVVVSAMGLVKSAMVEFASAAAADFSLDDLAFIEPESVVPLPTPVVLGLAGLGLAAAIRLRRR
ncbi:MAG: hypothetical protein JNM80_07830 [Phycisphaerae bacterium]|nr:hypothetical protein [Phycisphaerae bacterium]